MLIHLGDAEGARTGSKHGAASRAENCQVHMILGNNDFSNLEREKEISIGDYRAFDSRTLYSVSVGTERLADEARTVMGYRLPCSATPIKPCLDMQTT